MTTGHKATIEAVNAAFSANNIEAFLELCSDDIEMGIVGGTLSQGKDALRRDMDDNSWNPPVIHVTDIIIDGDRAVCDGIMEMSRKDGVIQRYGYADCYTFRDGKISAIRVYMHEIKDDKTAEARD